jgi:hypothetical protein
MLAARRIQSGIQLGPGVRSAGGEGGVADDGDTLVAQKVNAVGFAMGSVFQKPVAGLR